MEEGNVNFYYGDKKIINIEDGIYPGYKRVTLELENSSDILAETIDLPEWELKACSTTEPSDSTTLRNNWSIYVVDEIYSILKRLDVRVEDIGFILQKLLAKLGDVERNSKLEMYKVSDLRDMRISHWDKV